MRFGRRPSHRTIRRVLATDVLPVIARRFPPYHAIPDAAERRLAIVRLHSEGWNKQSIAGYLETSRETVHTTLRRWIAEGLAGLDDKPRGPHPGSRQVDLSTMRTVRELQETPELGEFRIHAALKQLGIELAPCTCGRILAVNRRLYGLRGPARAAREPKPMPFRASYVRFRHWWVYGERGLAGDAAAVWLYGETLTVSFADEALAQFTVSYQPDRHQLAAVTELERFETHYQSPQPPLWDLAADDWLTMIKVEPYAQCR